jgi:YVTN family beta-propeller protein
VTVIDPALGLPVGIIAVGVAPFFIAVSPDGTRAYVPNSQSASVSVINTTTDAVVATIPVGSAPVAVAFNPAGTKAYVANSNGGVSVIDTATATVVNVIPLTGMPYGVAVSPDGATLYASQYALDQVSIFNTTTNLVVATVATGNEPESVTFNPTGTKAYIPTVANVVSVIDVATRTALPAIASGDGSRVLAFTPDGTLAYVSNNHTNTVTVIGLDEALPTITGTPPAATLGQAYSFTPTVTGTAATVNLQSGTLPAGLTLSAGVISGTPVSPGSFAFTLRATNGNGYAEMTRTITVNYPVPTITGTTPAAATVGVPFSWSPTVTALPGYTVTSGALPDGLVMDTGGTISGTPTGLAGSTPVILNISDLGGSDTFTLTIDVAHGAAQTLALTPSDATPQRGDTISLTVAASDTAGNSWDVTGDVAIDSDVLTDVVAGNEVTFVHASPHTLTATLQQVSGSIVVQVAAADVLGMTGATFEWWVVVAALVAVAAGVVLVLLRVRARRGP